MSTFETIVTEREEAVLVVTIRREEKRNALNERVLRELLQCFADAEGDRSILCAILTGAGSKAFVAGADISEMAEMSPVSAKAFSDLGHTLGARIEHARFPVIAAVNGFALGGGCELALACDFIHASDNAKFGQPEVNLGVIPGFGGTQRLARRVGIGRARELCYTGDVLDAAEALRIGLVNAVHPASALLPTVKSVAKKIAEKGPFAVTQCKRVIARGADLPLSSANEMEAQAFASLFGTEDQKEGMRAFTEKRAARFSGR